MPKIYYCPMCDKFFPSEGEYEEHVEAEHRDLS